jgi:uncharacterized protein (DUF1697 family)
MGFGGGNDRTVLTMTYVALLRAVNVGGTGKLAMEDLRAICRAEGLADVRTYIASGNVVFRSPRSAKAVKAALEHRLAEHCRKPVAVLLRTAEEMAALCAANPFPDHPGNRVLVTLLEDAPPADTLAAIRGRTDEKVHLGRREIYVAYTAGMASSKLRIPAAEAGTARNMNTVTRLAAMASESILPRSD